VQNRDSRKENNKTYEREVKCIWGCSQEKEKEEAEEGE